MTCTVCAHAARADIESQLLNRDSLRDIARQHGLSKDALSRHKAEHLSASLVKSEQAKEVTRADDLIGQLKEIAGRTDRLYKFADGIIGKAASTEDWRTALMAVREATNANKEARANLELLGELLGELNRTPTVNIHLSAEWIEVRTVLLEALQPFPAARTAVAAALTGVEHGVG